MAGVVELVLHARPRDLGDGFVVGRALPAPQRRVVGPFVFLDHMGPVDLAPGHGMDVRPHPHIGLATVTYLFSGEILHRDSLGSVQAIAPGDLNWMVAGRGITHSERSSAETRARGQHLHGLQAWVALPAANEEDEPAFYHHAAAELPTCELGGARLRVVAGSAFGLRSPVRVASPTMYVEAHLGASAELELDAEHAERAAYVIGGACTVIDEPTPEHGALAARALGVFHTGARVRLRADVDSHVMLLGGAPLDGPRYLDWNFVSSRKERLETAKQDWRAQRFPRVPGDDVEFIPLPER